MSLEKTLSAEIEYLNSTLCCTQNAERLREAGDQRPTDRQTRLLQEWSNFLLEHDRPPMFREAAEALGLKSPGPVHCMLRILLGKKLMNSDGSHYYPATGSPEQWKLRNHLSQALKLYQLLYAHEPTESTAKVSTSTPEAPVSTKAEDETFEATSV